MGLVLWTMFPMTAPGLMLMCCIVPFTWYVAVHRRVPWYVPSLVTASLLLATAYLFVNASWSFDPISAIGAVVLILLLVGVLHLVLNLMPELDTPPLRAMAVGALAGLAATSMFLCVEIFSDQSVRRFLMHVVPTLQPSAHHMGMAEGQPALLSPHLPNHNITVLALMFWPAALLARALRLLRAYRYAAAIAVALVVATVFASEHTSSKVALIGGGVAFVLFRLRPGLAMPLMVAGWVGANLLVVPAVTFLYSAEAYRAEWLPESARHRIVIWRYTSEQIPKAPILGAGISAARAMSRAEAENIEARRVPGTDIHLSTSVHSHNAYLQIWYEAGAAGALILLAVGLLILRALTAAPPRTQPYLAAAFAACALMVAFAYSIWAPWYVASLGMAAIFVGLGTALCEDRYAPGP